MLVPTELVTVSVIVYFPAADYLCVGFCKVEEVPSPKLHFHLVGDPVLVSVNLTFNGNFPEVGETENAATGFDVAAVAVI